MATYCKGIWSPSITKWKLLLLFAVHEDSRCRCSALIADEGWTKLIKMYMFFVVALGYLSYLVNICSLAVNIYEVAIFKPRFVLCVDKSHWKDRLWHCNDNELYLFKNTNRTLLLQSESNIRACMVIPNNCWSTRYFISNDFRTVFLGFCLHQPTLLKREKVTSFRSKI